MPQKKESIGMFIIASAIIWGAAVVGCALKLRGTECFQEISLILTGGAVIHLFLVMAPLAIRFGKRNKEEQ